LCKGEAFFDFGRKGRKKHRALLDEVRDFILSSP
jgi:hypothetical protein